MAEGGRRVGRRRTQVFIVLGPVELRGRDAAAALQDGAHVVEVEDVARAPRHVDDGDVFAR